jgi:hypothetical protein
MTTLTTLPKNYRQALRYPLGSRRMLLLLNVLAFAPLLLFGAAMFGIWVAYEKLGAPLRPEALADARLLPRDWDVWALLAAMILIFPVHELCHGLAFKLLGVPRVKYGVIPHRFVFYAKPAGEAYFFRNGFILAALMPLILITLGGLALLLFAPVGVQFALVIVVMLNAGGAIGDIWTVLVILWRRFPPDALAADLGDTFVVYVPDDG